MISKFKYRSFKDVDWSKRRPVGVLFFFVLIATIILYEPVTVLFIISILYALSGVMAYLLPDIATNVFKKLDRILWDIKILDDEEDDKLHHSESDSKEMIETSDPPLPEMEEPIENEQNQ
jgi:CDP-diacylglycerol---serine O-phosphatidyltransferase